MPLDAYASQPHYLAHLLPIWCELPLELRGHLYVRSGLERQAALGGALGNELVTAEPPRVGTAVIVSAYTDLQTVAPRRVVLVEHGAGQEYGDEHPSYSGGRGRETVALFIVPNEAVAERNRRRYPTTPSAVVGCPKLDRWLRRSTKLSAAQPTVAISFHWRCDVAPESRGAFEHYAAVIPELAEHHHLLGHAHPKAVLQLEPFYRQHGIEFVEDFEEVLLRADLYLTDNSSTLFEFAATGRPVVVLNAPWYRRDVDMWPRFWAHADVGAQVDEPEELLSTIQAALTSPEVGRDARERASVAVFTHLDGFASRRAVAAIQENLGVLSAGTLMSDNWITDPYAPSYATPLGSAQPVFPAERLMRLGAAPADLEAARQTWSLADEGDQAEVVASWAILTDDELREQIIQEWNRDHDGPTRRGIVAESGPEIFRPPVDGMITVASTIGPSLVAVEPTPVDEPIVISPPPPSPPPPAPVPAPQPVSEPTLDPVPAGSATAILAWCGKNKPRLRRALAAERATETPRTTLISRLERVLHA